MPAITDPPILTTVALALLAAAVVAAEPLLGRRQFARFLADVERDGEEARVRHLARWSAQSWAWAGTVVLVVALLPGVGLADLGLRFDGVADLRLAGSDVDSVFRGIGFGVVAVALLVLLAGRRARSSAARAAAPNPAVQAMLPRSRRGRWWWAGLSVTAGITEEIVYRGLLLLALAAVAPGLPVPVVVLVASLCFAVAHAYQGVAGMVVTGLFGAGLTLAYLATGSLVLPMLVHALADLRALLIPVDDGAAGPAATDTIAAERLAEAQTQPGR